MLFMLSEIMSGLPVISQDVDSTVTRQETLTTTSETTGRITANYDDC